MEKTKKLLLFISLLTFLYSCGGASDAAKVLRNEKIRNTDEFFVKKREPLSLPPDYKKLSEPNTIKKSKEEKRDQINQIFKIPKEQGSTVKGSLSVEQSIIDKIRK